MKKTTIKRNFILHTDKKTGVNSLSDNNILLYPFKNLSVQPFSFPFSGMSRVRDALKIQFRPLLGERAEEVSLVPLLIKSGKKFSEGATFLLHGENSDKIEGAPDRTAEGPAVWPLPLAFAAEINGSGLIIWADEDQVISLWLQNWIPMLYRWSARLQDSIDGEKELVSAYAAEQGLSLGDIFIADQATKKLAEIQECGARTLRTYSAYEHLDLSNRGANLLEQRERTVGFLMKTVRFAIACGLAFALACGGLFWQRAGIKDTAATFSENIYASAFGERSRQPLISIKEKLATLGSDKQDSSIQGILRTLGPVWDELTKSENIAIETMKFSQEKTDLLGTAKDNSAIQHLRTLLEERGLSLKTDNIQQIPGGGLRFTLSITKGAKS